MARQLRVRILTPEKVVYEDNVDMVVAPGTDGEIGLLPLHAPLVTPLATGEMRVKHGEHQDYVAVSGGYLEVREDQVTVLADNADIASEIDVAEAERMKAQAEQKMKEARQGEREDEYQQAKNNLDWALTRLRVASQRKD